MTRQTAGRTSRSLRPVHAYLVTICWLTGWLLLILAVIATQEVFG